MGQRCRDGVIFLRQGWSKQNEKKKCGCDKNWGNYINAYPLNLICITCYDLFYRFVYKRNIPTTKLTMPYWYFEIHAVVFWSLDKFCIELYQKLSI